MSTDRLLRAALEAFDSQLPGAYYGSATGLGLGAGLIYDGIPVAFFNRGSNRFEIIETLVLVLTHECDVANERAFNDHVLVCPILPLTDYVDEANESHTFDHAFNLVKDIAANRVHRVFFMPPATALAVSSSILDDGGLIYLNRLSSVDVKHFQGLVPVCAFSSYALDRFDRKMLNHLLRPKSEALPRLTG